MANKKKQILVVAAHPDDEVLGCGGTIARHAARGDTVHILIMAEGATSRDQQRDMTDRKRDIDGLRAAAVEAAHHLGAQPPIFSNFPDNRMDGMELVEIVKQVEHVAENIAPDIIYTHHAYDLNIDHRVTHQSVITACRPVPGKKAADILVFETLSSTEWAASSFNRPFNPDHYVIIAEYLESKLAALQYYNMEMRPFPHARSIETVKHLARYRGASVGQYAAEAFETIRTTWI